MDNKKSKNGYSANGLLGFLLIFCTILSLLVANTSWGDIYQQFWSRHLMGHRISDWINDGMMAIFFLLVGLELKREMMYGELRSRRKAIVPIAAAVGGMLVPALFYIFFNWGGEALHGFGIPMSTDIAFVLVILTILGNRVPTSLKVFLTMMAVIDDLGAVLVIAIFYASNLSLSYLFGAFFLLAMMMLLAKTVKPKTHRREQMLTAGLLLAGVGLWFLVQQSGVHASISGLMLAMVIPSYNGEEDAPSRKLEEALFKPVYYGIVPLFILCNAAIPMTQVLPETGGLQALLLQPHIVGIVTGLVVGKPLGILAGVWISLFFKWGKLPKDLCAYHIVGGGFLGGIGFTMAIFFATLAFQDVQLLNSAKLAVLASSLLSALVGILFLRRKAANSKSTN